MNAQRAMAQSAHAFEGFHPGRPAGIALRPIADADAEFLCHLYATTRAAELAALAWPEPMKRQFLREQFTFQHRHYVQVYKDADFLLVLSDAAAIGRIYVDRTGADIGLVDIALLPAWRGQGIGSALLGELIDEARATRRGIRLHVDVNNPAYRWYARYGFVRVEHGEVYDVLRWSPPVA
jgi:ribosomal protein S18 acetylase RimI-like enzyme